MAEIVRGYIEDLGMASATAQATPIVTDNDATMRIASDAASAKRATGGLEAPPPLEGGRRSRRGSAI